MHVVTDLDSKNPEQSAVLCGRGEHAPTGESSQGGGGAVGAEWRWVRPFSAWAAFHSRACWSMLADFTLSC